MARRKRVSTAIGWARVRSTAVKSIDPKLEVSPGLSAESFDKQIEETEAKLAKLNDLLSQVDGAENDFNAAEKALMHATSRLLAGVGVRFGKYSNEYEMAGGTRINERARRAPKIPLVKAA